MNKREMEIVRQLESDIVSRRPFPSLEELTKAFPQLRRIRRINASWLRWALGREPLTCTWCGNSVKPPKACWCSQDCVHAFKAVSCIAHQRRIVIDRDGDSCASCGSVGPFELDHVIPVAEGGGVCGPDNLRLLCLACHKRESRNLSQRLTAVRRMERPTSIGEAS